jgi:hypothetical protein
MKIDINKKYRYRSGKPARILCVDGPCVHAGEPQPVVSMDEDGETNTHFPSGRFISALKDSDWDLIEVREPREGWIPDYYLYETKEAANRVSSSGVIIRVREIID